MRFLSLSLFLCLTAAWAQTPPLESAEKGDAVIAVFDDGTKMTLDEFRAMLPAFPAEWQQQAQRDREPILRTYAAMRKAAQLAQQEKLDQRSPYKEFLAFTMVDTLANIKLGDVTQSMAVDPAEVEAFYNQHKDPYKKITVTGIKISFADPAAAPAAEAAAPANASRVVKKTLTEAEAKAKAQKLLADIRAGADFDKLVQSESDDQTAKAKGGEYGTWAVSENVPEAMRTMVFSLKEGEVSEPIQQANAFYLLRASKITYEPLSEVRDSIFDQLKKQKTGEWLQKFRDDVKVEFPSSQPRQTPGAPSAK